MPRHGEQAPFIIVVVGIGRDAEIVLLGEEALIGRTKVSRVVEVGVLPHRDHPTLNRTATRHLTVGRSGSDLLVLIEHVVKTEDSIQLQPLEGTEVGT